MARALDEVDRRLLDLLQSEVPLAERPFRAIAERAAITEGEALARIAILKASPNAVIRQISTIFDSQSLGYQSTLVASRVDEARIESAARLINSHPGVSHNYQRNHQFNLWYTLAVGPDSHLGLERTAEILHAESGALATRLMPTLKLFKIGVKFDLSASADPAARSQDTKIPHASRSQSASQPISETDKRMIRVLQQDLSIESRPFEPWADQAGVAVADLLEAGHEYERRKWMRRFSAVLRHREVGISANAMGVWAVPEDRVDPFGAVAASFATVTHCYLRPTYSDWPFNLFTMVHAPSREQCEQTLAAIAQATGIQEYQALYSTREFKKTRVRYFEPDMGAWEESHAPSPLNETLSYREMEDDRRECSVCGA